MDTSLIILCWMRAIAGPKRETGLRFERLHQDVGRRITIVPLGAAQRDPEFSTFIRNPRVVFHVAKVPGRRGTELRRRDNGGGVFRTPHRQRSSTSAPAEENLSLQTYTPTSPVGRPVSAY